MKPVPASLTDSQRVNRKRLITFYILLVISIMAIGRTLPVLTQNVDGGYKFGSLFAMLVW